jgi:hypothetical protein
MQPPGVDDEVKRLLAEGKFARARQLAKQGGRPAGPASRLPGPLIGVLFLAVLAAVTAATIYGMSFLGLAVLEGLEPVLDRVTAPLGPLLLSPVALALLGLAILVVGLPRAPKFRRPGRLRGGVIALALAFITFWPLQFVASRIPVSFPEFGMALHLLAGFISICLLTGGLESMRMANNTPRDDSWEFLN